MSRPAQPTETAYRKELSEAQKADLRRIENLKIIQIPSDSTGEPLTDASGNALILIVPALLPREPHLWEQAFQYFLLVTHALGKQPYRIVYFQSAFATPVWYPWWLLRCRMRLSAETREGFRGVCVVHPGVYGRVVMLGMRAWFGERFWGSLEYADRVEELWLDDVMSEEMVKMLVPDAVRVFESALVEQAKMMREVGVEMGVPKMEKEQPYRPGRAPRSG